MGSSGGFGTEAIVEIPGYEEERKRQMEERQKILDSIPNCPVCGEKRMPYLRWDGKDPHPKIKCYNEKCTVTPKITKAEDW